MWKVLLSSPVENQQVPVSLFFLYFPTEFFEFSLIPGAKFDGHRGTWIGFG